MIRSYILALKKGEMRDYKGQIKIQLEFDLGELPHEVSEDPKQLDKWMKESIWTDSWKEETLTRFRKVEGDKEYWFVETDDGMLPLILDALEKSCSPVGDVLLVERVD